MTGKTHLALGLVSGAVTAAAIDPAQSLNEATVTILVSGTAALLPDIDDDNSTVNKILFLFAGGLVRCLGRSGRPFLYSQGLAALDAARESTPLRRLRRPS